MSSYSKHLDWLEKWVANKRESKYHFENDVFWKEYSCYQTWSWIQMIESVIPKFECHCNHEVPGRPSTKHSFPQKSSPPLQALLQRTWWDVYVVRFSWYWLFRKFKHSCKVWALVPTWCHQQVTVHSGILKCNGKKNYIAHFSHDRKHETSYLLIMLLRT